MKKKGGKKEKNPLGSRVKITIQRISRYLSTLKVLFFHNVPLMDVNALKWALIRLKSYFMINNLS